MTDEPNGADEPVPEPPYAGVSTFLKSPTGTPESLDSTVDVGVLGVPYDGGVSAEPGARHGPRAIRAASSWYGYVGRAGAHNVETGRDVEYTEMTVWDCGDVPTVPNDAAETRKQIRETVNAVAETAFPVVLGGDHSITYPSFLGVADHVGAPIGVVHLDAHSDTIESTPLHGRYFHGSPMARIDDSPYGSYETHAMVGIRGYEPTDFPALVEDRGLSVSYAADVRECGIAATVDEAIEHATAACEAVYLTVDVDVVDPAYAPGTGTPVPGGITSGELLSAMDRLGGCDAICALDLVEVAPERDPTDETARLAASAIARFLEAKFL